MDRQSEPGDATDPAAMAASGHVLVRCFDMVDDLIEVDLAVLEPFQPRLLALIKHDPPAVDEDGRKFWRSGLPVHLFTSLLMSLKTRRLCLGKNVSLSMLMHAFEYEGIVLATPFDEPAHFQRLPGPQAGVAHPKLDERAVTSLKAIAEQVATALVSWPRLEDKLRLAKTGAGLPRSCVSPTRVWLSFDVKPALDRPEAGADRIVALVKPWPSWLKTLLLHIGVSRAQLLRRGAISEAFSMETYKTLTETIRSSPLGILWAIAHDVPSHARTGEENLNFHKAHDFVGKVRQAVLGAALEPDHTKIQFARSIVQFASTILTNAPNFAVVFGPECADANGMTVERKFLAESLTERGVDIVRWVGTGGPYGGGAPLPDTARPMSFPSLSDTESRAVALLDFSRLL